MTGVTVGQEKLEVVPFFYYIWELLICRWHLRLISQHLQRKSLQFVHQECHAPCKRNLGPSLVWFAPPAMQWPSYSCGVTTKDQVSSQERDKMQLDDLAKALHPRWLRWHSRIKCNGGWVKKFYKLNLMECCSHGHLKKTWTEVIGMDCLVLGVSETHPSIHPYLTRQWETIISEKVGQSGQT